MHFEFLVEDSSGKKALDILVPKIIGDDHTYNVRDSHGIGHIPKGLQADSDARAHTLLNKLPALFASYGKIFASYPKEYQGALIVVCDLDNRCLKKFRKNLFDILNSCETKPITRFCFAIEEGEAWFLGDIPAIKAAYPNAKDKILRTYVNDSICGTWECLADAVYRNGAAALKKKGYPAIGIEKKQWAERIAPQMDINRNASPSFRYFCKKLLELGGCPEDDDRH